MQSSQQGQAGRDVQAASVSTTRKYILNETTRWIVHAVGVHGACHIYPRFQIMNKGIPTMMDDDGGS